MTNTPKVSIVVPVYNVERYLPACLDSILAQTLREIEVICVNDGSPDGSPEILAKYAAMDSRIKVVHKENGGLSSARNAAYPLLRGTYTLFVDSDDFIEPELCEKTVASADRENADMTLFFFSRTTNLFYGGPLENFLLKHPSDGLGGKALIQHMNAWSKLWKTEFLLKNDILFPPGIYYEDLVVHWKAVRLKPGIAVVPERLYCYRVNDESIIHTRSRKHGEDVLRCFEIIKNDLRSSGDDYATWRSLYLWQKFLLVGAVYYTLPKACRKEHRRLVKDGIEDMDLRILDESDDIPPYVKTFFKSLDRTGSAGLKRELYSFLIDLNRRFSFVAQFRHWFRAKQRAAVAHETCFEESRDSKELQ